MSYLQDHSLFSLRLRRPGPQQTPNEAIAASNSSLAQILKATCICDDPISKASKKSTQDGSEPQPQQASVVLLCCPTHAVQDSNGNYRNIGTAVSDSLGIHIYVET